MKKDNFDLRSYLVENKMTENSRGEVRHQLGETVLDTRILSELRMPADPYDHHDPDYDENWAAGEGADMADAYNDAQKDVELEENYLQQVRSAYGEDDSLDDMKFNDSFEILQSKNLLSGNPQEDYARICDYMNDGVGYDMKYADGWRQEAGFENEPTDECLTQGIDMPINERSYTDDDDDDDNWERDDLDFDDNGGSSLLDLVRGDKKAASARKAAARDTAADDAMADDAPATSDAPEIDDPDADNAAGESDPNAAAQPGLSAQIKYDPSTVELEMDDAELDQFLSGFRRPQVAVRVLNQALKSAQDEVNDSIGLKHLYLILEKGFYVTSRSPRGNVIAKVSANQAWRDKNFGEDS